MEKSSQGCYKEIQIDFCDSYHNNIIEIQNRLSYSNVVYPAIEYPSRECIHDIKESKGKIFKENVQGRKHPGSCVFAEPELLM